jgi:hypothetical protein
MSPHPEMWHVNLDRFGHGANRKPDPLKVDRKNRVLYKDERKALKERRKIIKEERMTLDLKEAEAKLSRAMSLDTKEVLLNKKFNK